jgi:hypothetical protein
LGQKFMAFPRWRKTIHELQEMYVIKNGKKFHVKVDFNQGLDSSFIKDLDTATELRKAKVDIVRLAYDQKEQKESLEGAIQKLKEVGFTGRRIFVYTLYNFKDNPQDFWERVCDLMDWGVAVYPMRFEPLDSLEKNKYIAPSWNKEHVEMVAKAQRVIGEHGAFTPFDAMRRKITLARNFEEAFQLRPENHKGETHKQEIEDESEPKLFLT